MSITSFEAKKALESSAPGEKVEVVVDNEIAVQNLKKLADHKGLSFASEKKSSREYVAVITAGEGVKGGENCSGTSGSRGSDLHTRWQKKRYGSVLSSNQMGQGDEVLGSF